MPNYACRYRSLSIPFPTSHHANIARQVLSVERELKPSECQKTLTVNGTSLVIEINAISARVLRTSSSSILEMVGLVVDTMGEFGENPVLPI
ncbi:transcription factor Pcc1-domain-containing protein [Gaertneriomyces semiglobifer]|nr:transcription factor Pcc1-domain-containing protein [Gaertneriomyces semiglobifer]